MTNVKNTQEIANDTLSGNSHFKAWCAVLDTLRAVAPEALAGNSVTPVDQVCNWIKSQDKSTKTPFAYAIYGIGTDGKHYLSDIKIWSDDDCLSDDDGLGEFWAGNEKLYKD